MKTDLYTASRQWSIRPVDERFWTPQEMFDRTKQYAEESREKEVALSTCSVSPDPSGNGDLVLYGQTKQYPCKFQHYSFGQLCNITGTPASYVRNLPADLAAANMNHGLAKVKGNSILYFHKNGGLQLRCVTSKHYERIYNYQVADAVMTLEDRGWRVPPARPNGDPNLPTRIATQADVLRNSSHPGLGVKVGDTISPAGLYASDHDMFAFIVNEDRPINAGNGEVLYRGAFFSNSEVGDAKLRITIFLYDSVCGNHIVWGAKVLGELSRKHMGNVKELFADAVPFINRSINQSAAEDEARIRAAKGYLLGPSKEETVDKVFGKSLGLSRRECEDAYVLADRHSDTHNASPNSAWGFAAGVTRLSQQNFADKRNDMDRAAGKVLELAF